VVFAAILLLGAGRLQADWGFNGVPVCGEVGHQRDAQIISDGAGGAIMVWRDGRGADEDIYAQRIFSSVVMWTVDGVPICTATRIQAEPKVVSDGAGGAIISWHDHRSDTVYSQIYAQRVNKWGTIQWVTNGVPLSTATVRHSFYNHQLTSDGAGGAIVAWEGIYNTSVFAQRIDALGSVQWALDGVELCLAYSNQYLPRIISDGAGGAIVPFQDNRGFPGYDIYVQQIDAQGRLGYLLPDIHTVSDIPGDQGGFVNLIWDANRTDYLSGEITEYTLWRALETPMGLGMIADGALIVSNPSVVLESALEDRESPILWLNSLNGQMLYWELISTQTAYRLQGYAKAVPTLFDSTAICDGYHYFQVIAHTSDPSIFYVSEPDSGYSVDNLAPGTPVGFTVVYNAGSGRQLTWDPCMDDDFQHYRVYCGESWDFEPAEGNLVHVTTQTYWLDTDEEGFWGHYYKLTAVDCHGNESGPAVPESVTDVETPDGPKVCTLYQNVPNPFNPLTTIRYYLPRRSRVTLEIYDISGRVISSLVDEEQDRGHYAKEWNGLDDKGSLVASGVYFYRLIAGKEIISRKMLLVR